MGFKFKLTDIYFRQLLKMEKLIYLPIKTVILIIIMFLYFYFFDNIIFMYSCLIVLLYLIFTCLKSILKIISLPRTDVQSKFLTYLIENDEEYFMLSKYMFKKSFINVKDINKLKFKESKVDFEFYIYWGKLNKVYSFYVDKESMLEFIKFIDNNPKISELDVEVEKIML